MCYWYCSLKGAQDAVRGGIPAMKSQSGDGVVVTLVSPQEIMRERGSGGAALLDVTIFPQHDAVLVCSLPRALLCAPTSTETASTFKIRVLPYNVLAALRPAHFGRLADAERWHMGELFLPPQQILRAYQLFDSPAEKDSNNLIEISKRGSENSRGNQRGSFIRALGKRHSSAAPVDLTDCANRLFDEPFLEGGIALGPPVVLKDCLQFIEAMAGIREVCASKGWLPLYHYSHPTLAPLIAKGGLRMSTNGQGDGGVYFSTKGPASYRWGTPSFECNLIVDCFGMSRLEEYRGKGNLDLVVVYGADPWILNVAPGGRDNARMVSKETLETMSLSDEDRNYFLRPDRILGMFKLNAAVLPKGYVIAVDELDKESEKDRATKNALAEHALRMDLNEDDMHDMLRADENADEHASQQVITFLKSAGLDGELYGQRLATLGYVDVSALKDREILSDMVLVKDVRMSKAEVRQLRAWFGREASEQGRTGHADVDLGVTLTKVGLEKYAEVFTFLGYGMAEVYDQSIVSDEILLGTVGMQHHELKIFRMAITSSKKQAGGGGRDDVKKVSQGFDSDEHQRVESGLGSKGAAAEEEVESGQASKIIHNSKHMPGSFDSETFSFDQPAEAERHAISREVRRLRKLHQIDQEKEDADQMQVGNKSKLEERRRRKLQADKEKEDKMWIGKKRKPLVTSTPSTLNLKSSRVPLGTSMDADFFDALDEQEEKTHVRGVPRLSHATFGTTI